LEKEAMETTSQLNDILPGHPRTEFLIMTLGAEWYSVQENRDVLVLHFSHPEGSLKLTIQELRAMNHLAFLAGFQMNRPSKQGILAAVKFQFGKVIWNPEDSKSLDEESPTMASSY
jgi:hypothetical protein